MLLERRPGQPLALPGREVGVLDRQARQRRRPPRGGRLVRLRQLGEEDRPRGVVGDEMVADDEQAVSVVEMEERRPQHPVAGKVEGLPRQLGHDPVRLVQGVRASAQVDHFERDRALPLDRLRRSAVDDRDRRPKDLVSLHDRVERRPDRILVERPGKPEEAGHVVGAHARHQLLQEKHPLLCERQRRGAVGAPGDRLPRAGGARGEALLEVGAHGVGERAASSEPDRPAPFARAALTSARPGLGAARLEHAHVRRPYGDAAAGAPTTARS